MRTTTRRGFAAIGAAIMAGSALAACSSGGGGEYPDGAVTYVVPYNPGGSSDPAGREFARLLGEELGVATPVENLPGGDETVGLTDVILADPDGYRVGLTSHAGIIVQPLVNPQLPFQGPDDYTALSMMLDAPNALFVPADSPHETLEEFVAAAEDAPGEISIGSTGRLTSPMFSVMRLGEEAGVELNFVPFSGGAGEAALAAMSGEIDAFAATAAGQLGLVESGDIRPLAHTGDAEFNETLPGAVSYEEAGYDVPFSATYVTVAAPELPDDVRDRLVEATSAVAESDEWAQWCQDNGFVAAPMIGDDLDAWVVEQTAIAEDAIAMSEATQ